MKYIEPLILESKNIGYLYHFTSFLGFIHILNSMSLKSGNMNNHNTDFHLFKKYKYYISFTRNNILWKHLSDQEKLDGNIKLDIRLKIDGNKLSQKYKIEPYNDNYEMNFHVNKKIKAQTDLGNEMEERLYTNEHFLDIKNYLLEVMIVNDDTNNINGNIDKIEEIIKLCEKNNIPLKIYHKQENKILEQNMWDLKKDLKHFHNAMDLDITIKELMTSLDGIEMDLETIFPCLNGNEKLKDLPKWKKFNEELKEYKLKLSELFDTNDLQTFSRLQMKWYWIYADDASDLDTPIYILFKYFYKNKWSDIKLYYIQEDITKFLNTLSTVTIEFRVKNNDKRWFYKTVDSGSNWTLEKDMKNIEVDGEYIEVKSNEETATFKNNLKWINVLDLSKRNDLELFIY